VTDLYNKCKGFAANIQWIFDG